MSRLLTAGLSLIIVSLAFSANLTRTTPTTTVQSGGSTKGFCSGKSDGNYPNPNNSNAFYMCSNGLTYNQKCQEGLIFKQSCNCCDWPTNTTSTITVQSGGSTGGFCSGKSDGNYVNPNNSNAFYMCSNGLTYNQKCQEGLIFRTSCNCCDWPTNTTPTTTVQSGGSTEGFCRGKSDGNYPNPDNSNAFYMCSNGLTYNQKCQKGLIFKQSCNCCDWPTNTTPTTTVQSGGSTGGFCSGKSDGNYVNPNNSNAFYMCSNGLTYNQKCQKGLIFKQSCNCCDWPTNTTPTTTVQSGGSTKGFCSGKSDGNYPNPNNSNAFYMCSNGLTYNQKCQEGLIFKSSCNCCDWPTNTTSTITVQSGGSTGGFCSGKSDGNYVNPNNSNAFYMCSNGLTYNQNLASSASLTATAAIATTESGGSTDGFCNGKSGGNYVNPSNLNSFSSCSNGLTHIQYCPEELIFKQICSCCDWPSTRSNGSIAEFCDGKRDGNYVNPSNVNTFYSCSNGLTYIQYCPEELIFKASCNCCDYS
ncbi:chondroitin proteoglycan 2-like [Anabas testudineus]|uniref:chondroitin proteoglycan 2-like n=1 Tax=Anabas testudineus TaxID=64144 RepID=UPI00143D1628|nr:chondroitin proteoglycan 2-like [Anabas testudineus]